jgi:hypothetical protein
MDYPPDRRGTDFVERLSILLIFGAFAGGFIVLLDFKLVITVGGQLIQLGSGFAQETKGMVLQSMLIGGFAAVVSFWLNTTKQGQDQAKSVSKIAEQAAPATAAAVAANVAATTAATAAPPAIPIVPVVVDSPAVQPTKE